MTVLPPPDHHLARMESYSATTVTLSGSAAWSMNKAVDPLPWLLHFAHFQPHDHEITQAILAGTTIAICDGSYMPCCYPQLASAAWIIHTGTQSQVTCHGITQVHGPLSAINAYHAKLQGMLLVLLAVNHLAVAHHVSSGHLTISCNNQGVLSQVLHHSLYIPGASKHADLLQAIHHAHCHCQVSLSFQYVAGHQDDLLHFADLSPLAQLNMQADSMAKQALHILSQQHVLLLL